VPQIRTLRAMWRGWKPVHGSDSEALEQPTRLQILKGESPFSVNYPMTKRIEFPLGSPGRHERRDHIADDVWLISYINYSIFLHLAYAWDHLSLPLNSSFSEFYTHRQRTHGRGLVAFARTDAAFTGKRERVQVCGGVQPSSTKPCRAGLALRSGK
jgi:hypothetical protein